MSRKIIIDCDPGHDDAIAIMLAAGSSAVELLAITTVAGNNSVQQTTENALMIAGIAGLDDVPVAAGGERPLLQPPRWAEHMHGTTGLDGPARRPTNRQADKLHGVDLIAEMVMSHPPGEVTLIPTGPMTNIALAARMHPEIVPRVREIVFMGGAYADGNITPIAEFNVYTDPEAAAIVTSEAWPVTMVGLDLTHQAVATQEVRSRIAGLGNEASTFAAELLDFVANQYRASVENKPDPPVHDPCAVMRVIAPDIVRSTEAAVKVELVGSNTRGMTVVDFLRRDPAVKAIEVATKLDAEKFWDGVVDALRHLPAST